MTLIVVVDKDDVRRIRTREVLSSHGYEVTSFAEADVALRYLKARRPDLVLTTLQPDIMGIWLLREILKFKLRHRPRLIIWQVVQSKKIEPLAREACNFGIPFLAEGEGSSDQVLFQQIRQTLASPRALAVVD